MIALISAKSQLKKIRIVPKLFIV